MLGHELVGCSSELLVGDVENRSQNDLEQDVMPVVLQVSKFLDVNGWNIREV